jgi:hypothetical protein
MGQQEQVEVKLLQYTFRFKRMRWREEFAIKLTPNKNPQRILLAHALLEVSGLKPASVDEALQVMEAVPMAIVERVFRIWKGSFPASRKFTTSRLYKAPEPAAHQKRLAMEGSAEDAAHDQSMRQFERQFGAKELAETRETEQKILQAARRKEGGYRGAIPATAEEK